MDSVKVSLLVVVLCILVELHQCGRYGGGGRSSGGFGRSSSSRSSPSYGWSSSVARRPSPSPSHRYPSPSPSYHYPSARPTPRREPVVPRVTSRPVQNHPTPRREPIAPRVTSRPVQNVPTQRGPTPPPYHNPAARPATHRPATHRPATSRPLTTSRPASRPLSTSRSRTTPRSLSTSRPYAPLGSGTNANNAGWNLPPRPGAGPQGPPRAGYPSYSNYPSNQGYQGPNKVKIVNKYNYHYPGYYSLPVQHYSYPGYFYSTPTYRYSSFDTGSTALGFYLGYSLGHLTTPTFSHYSFYDGYRPRYDHYSVHHYYHNKEAVPQNQEIRPNAIVGCVGDSTTICPGNTTSLCTSTGALMCVVSATSTVPCSDNRQVNCVQSTISCVNNTAPECKNSDQKETSISIPCVSSAKIYGDLKYVNNTIIVDAPVNGTNTTVNPIQSTNGTSLETTTPVYSTKYPITTTPTPETTTPNTTVVRKRREVPQEFCVTIVALPAEKKPTEGELFYNEAKDIVTKFFENAWGL